MPKINHPTLIYCPITGAKLINKEIYVLEDCFIQSIKKIKEPLKIKEIKRTTNK